MLYGYIRMSGKNNELDKKIKVLENEGCEEIVYDISSIYENKRENLKNILDKLNKDDLLVIESLINLSREIIDCGKIIEKIIEREAILKVLDMGNISNREEDRVITKAIQGFIKFKKDTLVETARLGKEVAQNKKDFKDGRPKKYSNKQIENALSLLSINGGKLSYSEVSQLTKISKSTLIREGKKLK